jgi:uncharacterized membrane protein
MGTSEGQLPDAGSLKMFDRYVLNAWAPHPSSAANICPGEGAGTRTTRAEALSDGVFAVAMTLLVLDIKPPAQELWSGLLAQWPALAAYAVSFLTIGIVWVNHHRLFDSIRVVDRGLLFLNLLFLLSVALLPFPTAMLADQIQRGTHAQPVQAVAVYCFAMVLMGTLGNAIWLRAHWHQRGRMAGSLRFGVGLPLYAAAVPLALLSPALSLVLCALIAAWYAVADVPMAGSGD